jgi:hypothetical protein
MSDPFPLGVPEFAERTRRSIDWVRLAVRAGTLQHHRNGERGHIFFTEDDLRAYFASTLVPARQAAGDDG